MVLSLRRRRTSMATRSSLGVLSPGPSPLAFGPCRSEAPAVAVTASTSDLTATTNSGSQFLTLPVHPREQDPSGDGIVEREGGYIWHAPFENGQPPGHT